jgi:DNA-binding NarL/FixJ family response regulator
VPRGAIAEDENVALRCLIVDDSPHFLEAARTLLELQGVEVVGLVSTGDEAERRAEQLAPDVTLVDVDLGGESGFDVARRLANGHERPRSEVILTSAYDERDFADLIEASPALGFVSKAELSRRAIDDLLSGLPGT